MRSDDQWNGRGSGGVVGRGPGESRTGSRLPTAIRTFGALPIASMIRTWKTRRTTERLSPPTLVNPLSGL